MNNKMKRCGKCGFAAPYEIADEFWHRDFSRSDGFNSWCKACKVVYNKKRYREKTEDIKAVCRAYAKRFPERYRQWAKAWRLNNPERARANCRKASMRRYYKIRNNPEAYAKWLSLGRASYKRHAEIRKAKQKIYYWRNREQILEKHRKRYWEKKINNLSEKEYVESTHFGGN